MKRFLTYIAGTVSSLVLLISPVSAAPTRSWSVNMSEPSATTKKTLNIRYQVFSTFADDTFSVELFENNISKSIQTVTTDYGDSGNFTVNIPSAGTYTYKVTATNNEAASSKTSNEKTVQVSNDPEPIVTTVVVSQPTDGTTATSAGSTAGASSANGGVTTDQAATDERSNEDVLGAEDKKDDNKKSTANDYAVPLLLIATFIALGYYIYRRRMSEIE